MRRADRVTRLEPIGRLPIATDDGTSTRALHGILALARAEGLTTYDAAYLDLVPRRGLPLATRDRALYDAGRRARVGILPE